MKRFIFFLLIFMAGIGWSMPPPAEEQNLVPGKELTIRQEVSFIQPQLIYFQDVTEAQEVAFIYRGDCFVNNRGEVSLISHAVFYCKQFSDIEMPKFLCNNYNKSINRLLFVQTTYLNRQNSNFGYPLMAD